MTSPPRAGAEATLALAHALRTPLTSLALGLGLLDDGALGPLSEAQREVVRVLVAEVARLSVLVGRELRIEHLGAHAGPVELCRTDLGRLVEQAVAPLSPQAEGRAIALRCDLSEGVVAVVDPVKMGWVIASMVGNALRYSPNGGVVALGLSAAAGDAELTITDQGPGMEHETAGRVFERGGGLGLFLVREIVEAHGGTIEVESEVGRGTTFTIKLPAESTPAELREEETR